MDSTTHSQMERLVLRASAPGSQKLRNSFYANDGSNNPPPSPTAKWKGDVHAYEEKDKGPTRHPYLPHPYPLKRRGRAQNGHPGGFTSLQEPLVPPKFPDEEQIYCTYAEWWQAQRPTTGHTSNNDKTFSTSFWPYGRRISCITSMDKEDQCYHLDQRVLKNHVYYKNRREQPLSMTTMSKSQSSADVLMGSQHEQFGHNRRLGHSMTQMGRSHAGAAFHENKKLFGHTDPLELTSAPRGGRNVWDSLKAQASAPNLHGVQSPMGLPAAGAAAGLVPGQRAASAPSTSRSQLLEAPPGNRYEPKPHLKSLGQGSRTHAEWCLPQPPVRASA